MVNVQIFSLTVGILRGDASQRQEQLGNLQSALEDLEQHLGAKSEPFFGGTETPIDQ